MTTTPQPLTLAGEDYVVIPRNEYERLRAAADDDAADVAGIKRSSTTPTRLGRRQSSCAVLSHGNTPCASGARTAAGPPARWPSPRASQAPTSPPSSAA